MSPARKTAKEKFLPMHIDSPHWADIDEELKSQVGKRRPGRGEIERAEAIYTRLSEEFPDVFCALNFADPFQLLVATILSAQCTDERVNQVTRSLFRKYKKPADYLKAKPGELELDIRSTGFFNNKARAIREVARAITEEFAGKVPREMEKLLTLRGAARKTANVVRMHAFGLPGISVDTHFQRIMQRLKLTKSTDPRKIEFDIAAILPPEHWTHFADAVILHGRKTCQARSPKCDACRLNDLCPSAGRAVPPRPDVKSTTRRKPAT